jgi:hypothetical protein
MFFSVFCSRNVRLQSGKRQSASLPRYRTSFQARGHSGGSLPSSSENGRKIESQEIELRDRKIVELSIS